MKREKKIGAIFVKYTELFRTIEFDVCVTVQSN